MRKISKHQQHSKHSLDYDIIFKGKKEEYDEYESTQGDYYQDSFQYDPSTPSYDEAYNNLETERRRKITQRVYDVIKEKSDINLTTSRRKPSKIAFNQYFILLKNELSDEKFTNVEIFNELAVYFSDNLMSIFKLLDNQWRNLIIAELQSHIGNPTKESLEIEVKNLTVGSEIEFKYLDDLEDIYKLITGVILEYNKEDKIFKIDSFENIYFIKIDDITRIMNNRKFKYNLNKLNNIDFL